MAIETGLEGKPWYVAAIVAAVLGAGLFVLVHYLKFSDMKEDMARKDVRLSELQEKISNGRAAERSLPQFREDVQRLELRLERLLRILPARRNTEDLLRRFRTLGEQGDLNLVRLTDTPPRQVDFYSEWPIRLQIEGTYHNLALFFDRVTRFARIINIENLQIRATREGGPHTLAAQFIAKTFLYNEPEEGTEDEEL